MIRTRTRRARLAALMLGLSAAVASAPAAAERHAVALKAGLLGLGLDYAYSPVERWALRVGVNRTQFGFDAEESGIDYDFDLVFDSTSLAIDFHPTRGALRLSAGVLRNGNRLDAESRSAGQIEIGGDVYDADEVGVVLGRADFDDHAPFVGIGWDASRRPGRRLGWTMELGVLKQGDPQVTLSATGPISELPAFESDLAAEQAELADALDDLDLAPFAAFGIVIRF